MGHQPKASMSPSLVDESLEDWRFPRSFGQEE